MSSKTVIIIGYGSIGKRHHRILQELGIDTKIYSRHHPKADFQNLDLALAQQPNFIFICSETHLHKEHLFKSLSSCLEARILLEKPVGFLPNDEEKLLLEQLQAHQRTFVGFNLRFHPLTQHIIKQLEQETVLHAHLKIHRHLPTMRGTGDYKKSYSCYAAKGGGVLNDFSHDLDLACLFFGEIQDFTAKGGKIGDLHGDSFDHVTLLSSYTKCKNIMITMSYLSHQPSRKLEVITKLHEHHFDFDNNSSHRYSSNHRACHTTTERKLYDCDHILSGRQALDLSYQKQINTITNHCPTEPNPTNLCTLKEALATEMLILAIESHSNTSRS